MLGNSTKEGSPDPSRKDDYVESIPRWHAQGIKGHTQTLFLNPDPLNWWYRIKNVARVRVKRESCMALLDNGTQINTIILGFIKNNSLDMGPLSGLVGRWVTCTGLGNILTQPISYIVIPVQADGVQGYDEDQKALVIPDFSNFMAQVPMNLGTATISHIMNVIKEREIDTLATPWVNAQEAYLLAVRWATTMVEDDKVVYVIWWNSYHQV